MKTNRNEIHFEHSLTSMDFLIEKASQFLFEEYSIENPWFIDHPNWNQKEVINKLDDPVDVVLFGSYLRRFFETGNLIHNNYRFWCISEQVKAVYVNLLGFNSDSISVIPREVFRTSKKCSSFPDHKFDLVHAGRISPVKNIEFYLYFCHELQTNHEISCRPVLFGDFDNIQHEQNGRHLPIDYANNIKNLISSLSWKIKPHFAGLYPMNEWINHKELDQPVLASFSTYICEDFSVSTSQAEEAGWPCILSAWGGHLDATGSEIYHIPRNLIGESGEADCSIKGKARALAREFATNRKLFISEEVSSKSNTTLPSPLSLSQLDKLRRDIVSKWGIDTLFINREQMDIFADSNSGRLFFNEFKKLFGKVNSSQRTTIITFDHNLEQYPNQREASQTVERLCYIYNTQDSYAEIIPSRDISHKVSIAKILDSQNIIFPFFEKNMDPLLNFISEIADKNTSIYVLTDNSKKTTNKNVHFITAQDLFNNDKQKK
ncbi:MAG: hypothetical protein KC493_13320 [Bacteriovoracaceae bacterium]|nr:hypothetical protein [Bacteriovoracaceae bacterium]